MRYLLILILIGSFSIVNTLKAQTFTINQGVLSSDERISKVIDLVKKYIQSKDADEVKQSVWLKNELDKYDKVDLNANEFGLFWYQYYDASVLSVKHFEDSVYRTRVQFSYEDTSGVKTAFIYDFLSKQIGNDFKLINTLPYNTRNWGHKSTKYIDYVFPPEHEFNQEKADQMNNYIDSLKRIFNISEVDRITFYFTDDFDLLNRARGFTYYIREGNYTKPQGKVSGIHNIVYSGKGSELYRHEVTHLCLYPIFKNAGYLHEGIACFLSDHMGQDLDYHYRNLNDYLVQNPDLDLDTFHTFRCFDVNSNPQHVIAGLFIEIAHAYGGMRQVIRVMEAGDNYPDLNGHERYYKIIEDLYGVRQDFINEYIRKEIAERVE
ncbi:hypothetical protein GYB22_11360 [bacterium]|nr:hypothetical protein [bacterium]